jgi:hypothetical protein
MKSKFIALAVALFPACVVAQTALPAGTIVPVQLERGLNAAKLRSGQEIKARVTQDIPGTSVRKGAQVLGKVETATVPARGQAQLVFRFEAIEQHGHSIPFTADLRAVASPTEITDAETAMYGPDAGIDSNSTITQQIGGDELFRGGGPVEARSSIVGRSNPDGALAQPSANSEANCRGILDGNNRPQALWLFSTDACGIYGFSRLRIEHAGRTMPVGTIIITSSNRKLNINSGSGMLLRVQGS